MFPLYKPGDHIVTFNWGKISIDEVVVFGAGNTYYLKRIDKLVGGDAYLSGDNKNEAAKIWKIDRSCVIGRVVFKY